MRVILAEDSPLLRDGIARLLLDAGVDLIAAVSDVEGLTQAIAADTPDVVITDIRMPPTYTTEGLTAAVELRRRFPALGVLVLSQYAEPEYAEQLLQDGSDRVGYLLKDRVSDVHSLYDAMVRVSRGESVIDAQIVRTLVDRARRDNPLDRLTERERDVLGLMAEGRSNKGIGDRLALSPKTVESYIGSIMAKLDIADTIDDNRRVTTVVRYLRG